MIKEVDKNSRDTVIDLDGSETEVKFSAKYSYFALANNGDDNVIMSIFSGKSDSDDGVRIVLPGESAVIAAPGMSDRVFVVGVGRVQISALTEPINPFKVKARGGGGSGGGSGGVSQAYVDARDKAVLTAAKEYADNKLFFSSFRKFPNIGESDKLYIDKGTKELYIWDTESLVYVNVGGIPDDLTIEVTI